jgi:hypothetical protein
MSLRGLCIRSNRRGLGFDRIWGALFLKTLVIAVPPQVCVEEEAGMGRYSLYVERHYPEKLPYRM